MHLGKVCHVAFLIEQKPNPQAVEARKHHLRLRDERGEPTCEVTRVPDPASVGPVVGRYGALEFLPSELHDVLVVEIQAGARTLYGTINKFVSPKAEESGA